MSASNEKILLLTGLGIGAYLLVNRSAMAKGQPTSPLRASPASTLFSRQNRSPSNPAASAQAIYDPRVAIAGQLGGLVGKLFGSFGSSAPTGGGQTGYYGTGKPYEPFESDYPGSSTIDGIAANPSQDTAVIDPYDANGYGAG